MTEFEERANKATEEMAEVMQAISKCRRFGFTSGHPKYGEGTNRDNLRDEIYQAIECLHLLLSYVENNKSPAKEPNVSNPQRPEQVLDH